MDFKGKIAVITGGAQGIGRCIAEEFQKAGATACVIDKQQGKYFVGDLADKQVLEQFAKEVIEKHGHVDYLVNNALPLMKGIDECSYEEFQYAMSVGVTAPFYLAKLFAPHFVEGAAIVNISSSRDRMSQPQTEMVLYLCSDKAGFITGENICIDGGMTRQMIYHGDHGWTLT